MHLSEVVCRAGFARPLERVLTEQRMEQALVRGNPELRNWLIKAFAFVAVFEIAYLLAGNLLLNGRFLPQMLSRDPDRLSIEWVSAWTLVPGHLRVTGLTLRGQTAQQQWWLSMDYGEARLALGSLFARTFRLQGVQEMCIRDRRIGCATTLGFERMLHRIDG